MNYWLILVPFFSAIIGWLGAVVAGKILLGKVNRSRREIANRLGDWSAAQFSVETFGQQLTAPASIGRIMPVVEAHIDDFLRNKLKEKMPMIGMLIGDKTVQTLKEIFLKEIEEMFPLVMARFSENLGKDFDLRKLVTSKIENIPEPVIAQALTPVIRYYAICAAVIGFVIGVVNLAIFYIF